MRREPNSNLRVQFSFTTGYGPHGGEKRAHLEVTDEVSGMAVVAFELDPEQLMQFIAGSDLSVNGFVPASEFRHRIGKTMEHESVTLGRAKDADEATEMARSSVPAHFRGFEDIQISVRQNNRSEWIAMYRVWVNTEPAS